MLYSIDPERISNKEGPNWDAWISLVRGDRIDYAAVLRWVSKDENWKNQGRDSERGYRERQLELWDI